MASLNSCEIPVLFVLLSILLFVEELLDEFVVIVGSVVETDVEFDVDVVFVSSVDVIVLAGLIS